MSEASDLAPLLERLDSLEAGLLELEGSLERGTEAAALVHLLFREAHNLKSGLALAGFQEPAGLFHAAESLLDEARGGRREIDAGVLDALLATLDAARRSVAADPAAAEALAAAQASLAAIRKPAAGASAAPAGGAPAAPRATPRSEAGPPKLDDTIPRLGFAAETTAKARQAQGAGSGIYALEKMIDPRLPEREIASLPVFETISGLGELLAYRVIPASADAAVLRVLFSSKLDETGIGDEIFDPCYVVAPPEKGGANREAPSPGRAEAAGDPARSAAAEAATPPPLPRATTPDLPRRQAAQSPGFAPLHPARSQALPRILIVDDEATSLFLLQLYASAYGRVSSAVDAPEAVVKFSDALDASPYELVFLDILLPSASGSEVLARLRELEAARGVVPGEGARIIMVSALQDYETISAAFRGQADAYLTKPLERSDFDACLAKFGYRPLKPQGGAAPR